MVWKRNDLVEVMQDMGVLVCFSSRRSRFSSRHIELIPVYGFLAYLT